MTRLRSLLVPVYSFAALVLLFASKAYADAPDVSKIENFATNVITVLITLAGLLAAGFFVYGGINYISSSGHPERLDRAKKTIIFSAIGLAICIGAYILTNVVTQLANSSFK
jgi:hypothetical protein